MEKIVVDKSLLNQGRDCWGSFGHVQLRVLGQTSRRKGWPKRLIGLVITKEERNDFVALKNAHLEQYKSDTYWKIKKKYPRVKKKKLLRKKKPAALNRYPKNWKKIKKTTLSAYSHKCFICGKTNDIEKKNHQQKLSIHHINGKKRDCDWRNLVVLCKSCHIIRVHKYQKGKGVVFPNYEQILDMRNLDIAKTQERHAEELYANLYGDPCDFLK